jgi:hypothetical protein
MGSTAPVDSSNAVVKRYPILATSPTCSTVADRSGPADAAAPRDARAPRVPARRAAYARRKATVEPVFGEIRACRGIRQLSFRGLFKNRCEWLLICATHNLVKLWRAARRSLPALSAAAV